METKANYFLILGLNEDADLAAIDAAFTRLCQQLTPSEEMSSKAREQAAFALTRIREAHTKLQDGRFRESHKAELKDAGEPFSPDQLKPFLGHVCVAAGIISYQDLMDAVSKQTDIDLPLGQILQERRLLSQTELDGMLMGQKLYGAPARPLETTAKRLLALGLITVDMVKIALIDQRTSMAALDELICKRGWVENSVLLALK